MTSFQSNIKNIGAEGYFYTEGDDHVLDDLITRLESEFGSIVNDLRKCPPGRLETGRLPELIAHLEVRTRGLRQAMLNMTAIGVDSTIGYIRGRAALVAREQGSFDYDPAFVKRVAVNISQRIGMPDSYANYLIPILRSQYPVIRPAFERMLRAFATEIEEKLKPNLKQLAKDGHINALKKAAVPEARVSRYSDLSFYLQETESSDLILGDSAIVFNREDHEDFRPFLDKGEPLKAVMLPISSNRILIGSKTPINPSPDLLRHGVAQCSSEFFISSNCSEGNKNLAERIGSKAHLLSASEMQEAWDDSINQTL